MGREFELKYRANAFQIGKIQAAFGPFREISMETAYFDTPDHSLSARKWTLRRRLENGISVCTLKIPLADGSRGEWETACGDILAAVPELCNLGAPAELAQLVTAGVTETCGARFTRQAATLTERGATLELALDQGVLLGGGKELPLCEVEVELKEGSEDAVNAFCFALELCYDLQPEPASKFKRALALSLKK